MINLKYLIENVYRLGRIQPGLKPHLYLKEEQISKSDRQKELKFHLQSERHCFLGGSLRCDPSRFIKKVIAIFF